MVHAKPKLLIVDDQSKNLFAMRVAFEDMDFEIIEASSGQEALKHVLYHQFFLILMDVQMPGMNGFETAQLIHGNTSTATIPIIFVTANEKAETDILNGYQSGAVDYIYKPVNTAILLSKTQIFLELWRHKQETLEANNCLLLSNARLKETTEKLDESNQNFKAFAHMAGHDLKTPLLQMTALTVDILGTEEDNINSRSAEKLRIIGRIGTRLASMIDGLLDFAEIDAAPPAYVNTDLSMLSRSVIEDMNHLITTSGAQISVGQLPTLAIEPRQIYQVFLNIIGNAIKYRRENVAPIINITSEIKPSDIASQPNFCHLSFSDNGIGFDTTKLADVFTPFQRLVGEGEYSGSGIGMGTVKKIIDRHKGSISATSIIGEGSTFTIILPMIDI